MSKLGKLDTMPFGKHRGRLLVEVIENDPNYIQWAMDVADLEIDDECQMRLATVIETR